MFAFLRKNRLIIFAIIFIAFILWAATPIWYEKFIIYINSQPTMQITSPSFEHEGNIPSKYTCDGENVSPALEFSDVPEGTEALALILDDPDAPVGTFNHWVVWNIDPSTREVGEGTVPEGGIEGTTSFGSVGYGGPCPPNGSHRYFFKIYALDTTLDLKEEAGKEALVSAMKGHIIAEAELMGNYDRR